MTRWYILDDDNRPVPAKDLFAGARWHEANPERRRVAEDHTPLHHVSTVFLCIDHQYGKGPPILFETIVFEVGTGEDVACERYSSWSDAEAGHAAMLRRWQKREAEAAAIVNRETVTGARDDDAV